VTRRGLTLLEVMVALVILGLVVTGYLQAFAGTARATDDARVWSQAVVYAEDAMETMLSASGELRSGPVEALGGGFERQVSVQPWSPDIVRVTVVVHLPRGASYEVQRLVASP
jgi:prepilin-type N-terminal cleavage/methylation domain-containing protein